MKPLLLIVDDEKHTREGLELALEEEYEIFSASDADEAFTLLDSENFDVVLTDLRMAGKSGMKVIDHAIRHPHNPVCIMMTAYGSVETAVEAMKRGAYDFITKPVHLGKLEILIKRAVQSRNLKQENENLHQRLDSKFSFKGIIGDSEALQKVLDKVRLVAPSKATVLIEGETGTGKELVAQMIHQNSPRSRQPLLSVHCAALAPNLLESELFGHEKGAFTGATERRIGRFEAANQGTLFLDEIGEIDASTQVKLLRFLEEKTFERLGSNQPIKVDVRLVCATNRDLEAMVRKKTFREDLFYRLNVVKIQTPPLRDRPEDIPKLLHHYLKAYAKENNFPVPGMDDHAMRALLQYPWPGNIRELRNFAENVVVLSQGKNLGFYDLDERFTRTPETNPSPTSTENWAPPPAAQPLLTVEENEKKLLRNALMQAKGNRTQAAKLLGMSRRTLHRKLVQWPEVDPGKS